MSEPLRHLKNTVSYTSSGNTAIKFWRIAFKITDLSYDFSKYDPIDLTATGVKLFDDDSLSGNFFYNLCQRHKVYHQFHPDFVQTYFLSLFRNTPFPCNIFVFIEEVAMDKGTFSPEHSPHQLTMSAANLTEAEKKAQQLRLSRGMGRGTLSAKSTARARGKKNGKNDSCPVEPDFEVFYIESPTLSVEAGSVNDLFLSLTSRYLRGSPAQRGTMMLRHHSFACFADSGGMEFIRYIGFRGIVPTMQGPNTLVPLILILGQSLGYKYTLRRINRTLGATLKEKLKLGRRLLWRPRHHLHEINYIYRQVELFLTQSYLISSIDYRNRLALDLAEECYARLGLGREMTLIKEQLQPMQQLMAQLRNQEIIRGQSSLRWTIVVLAVTMLLVVVIVSLILGVEPLMRLLNQLGINTSFFNPQL